jgi:hypothetical protein
MPVAAFTGRTRPAGPRRYARRTRGAVGFHASEPTVRPLSSYRLSEKRALEIVRDVGASLSGWESAARAAGLGADEVDLMRTVIVGPP